MQTNDLDKKIEDPNKNEILSDQEQKEKEDWEIYSDNEYEDNTESEVKESSNNITNLDGIEIEQTTIRYKYRSNKYKNSNYNHNHHRKGYKKKYDDNYHYDKYDNYYDPNGNTPKNYYKKEKINKDSYINDVNQIIYNKKNSGNCSSPNKFHGDFVNTNDHFAPKKDKSNYSSFYNNKINNHEFRRNREDLNGFERSGFNDNKNKNSFNNNNEYYSKSKAEGNENQKNSLDKPLSKPIFFNSKLGSNEKGNFTQLDENPKINLTYGGVIHTQTDNKNEAKIENKEDNNKNETNLEIINEDKKDINQIANNYDNYNEYKSKNKYYKGTYNKNRNYNQPKNFQKNFCLNQPKRNKDISYKNYGNKFDDYNKGYSEYKGGGKY